MPAIAPGYAANLDTLNRAARARDLAVLDALHVPTGRPAVLVVAINHTPDGGAELVPLARMFDGDPYAEFAAPHPEAPGAYLTSDGRTVTAGTTPTPARSISDAVALARIALIVQNPELSDLEIADAVADTLRAAGYALPGLD